MSLCIITLKIIGMDILRKEITLWLKEAKDTRFHQNPIRKISLKKILLRAKPIRNLIIKAMQKLMTN